MRPQTLWYYLSETFLSLRRNLWMTIASVLTITLAMLILGLFSSLVTNLDYIASHVESQIEITVYLDDLVTEDMISSLRAKILNIQGVLQVEYVSRSLALQQMNELLGGDNEALLKGYEEGNNPLQDSFKVKAQKPEFVENIAEEMLTFDEIDDVVYGHSFVKQLLNFTSLVRVFGVVVMIGLGAAALFIVVNTIRLTVFARRREIEIMRYVGATNFFIRVPFFLEGLILGFLGSGLAFYLVSVMYNAVEAYFKREMLFMTLAPAQPFLNQLGLWMFLGGALFGVIGSTITLGRYLKA